MATARTERRLAAIMAADIVGYSRLVEQDEAGTLAAIRELRREAVDPLLAEHQGRIVKLMGDGAIVEFGSVVDAVACAVAVQRAVAERQADVPAGRRIVFRIGVNLGDVVVEGDGDLLGDGVNIAARLEQLCEPGGVMVSGTAYDHLQGRLRLPLDFAGEQHVKNISRPVPAYRVRLDGAKRGRRLDVRRLRRRLPVAAAAALLALVAAGGGWWWLRPAGGPVSDEPSLAVLPLTNMSGDAALDYFSDGLTEDLTTQLARFPELGVLARNSASTYKGKAADVKQVGRELGVRYVLEGSVRKGADKVRVTAQLIDATTGHHVWADRFDEEGTDVFALQDRVVQKVAAAVAGEHGQIRTAGYRQAWEKPDAELAEYDYFLRVHSLIYRFTREGMEEARRVALEGLGRFPGSALIRIKLGWVDLQFARFGWSDDPRRDLGEAYRLAEQAMAAANLPIMARLHGHWLLAMLHGRYTHDARRVEAEAEAALGLASGDSEVRGLLCEPYVLVGLAEKGIALVRPALDRDPILNATPWPHGLLAFAYFVNRQYEEAIAEAGKARGEAPLTAAASHAALGRLDEARAALGEALAREPGLTLAQVRQRNPFRNPADLDRLVENLRKAGPPGPG